jgi:hypothetical protein
MKIAFTYATLLLAALACDNTPTTPDGLTGSAIAAPTGARANVLAGELTVTVSAEVPPYPGTGDHVYTASVTGGSGNYVYHWFQRGCNVMDGGVWCMSTHAPWGSGQGLTSVTIWRGPYDVQVEVIVQVQDLATDTPRSGVGTAVTSGPNEAYWNPTYKEGSDSLDPCGREFTSHPLSRRFIDPQTGQPVDHDYGRNQCTGQPNPAFPY